MSIQVLTGSIQAGHGSKTLLLLLQIRGILPLNKEVSLGNNNNLLAVDIAVLL